MYEDRLNEYLDKVDAWEERMNNPQPGDVVKYTDWIERNDGTVRDYVDDCRANGWHIDLMGAVKTFTPEAVRVNAIDRLGTSSWTDKGVTHWLMKPVAWVSNDEPGNEIQIDITDGQYLALLRCAADDDYREAGSYVAFANPPRWMDVFEEI